MLSGGSGRGPPVSRPQPAIVVPVFRARCRFDHHSRAVVILENIGNEINDRMTEAPGDVAVT